MNIAGLLIVIVFAWWLSSLIIDWRPTLATCSLAPSAWGSAS